ncbi:hypothetical protein B0H14DRAFT_3453136 [Mycena olivaceomarginata]|nr:hypothetical protein B0H14DRAFT_3453136 [Mycena olivaceomarginata]
MPPSSAAEKILEYTMVAADALQEVASLTQTPFLGLNLCTHFHNYSYGTGFKRSDASGWWRTSIICSVCS